MRVWLWWAREVRKLKKYSMVRRQRWSKAAVVLEMLGNREQREEKRENKVGEEIPSHQASTTLNSCSFQYDLAYKRWPNL